MRTRIASIVVLTALVGLVFAPARASENEVKQGKGRAAKIVMFSASGVYSGPLSGTVLVGDETVEINRSTRIVQIGKGVLEEGASVSASGLIVTGVVRKGKKIATSVMVSEPASSQDFSETTLENVEASPARAR